MFFGLINRCVSDSALEQLSQHHQTALAVCPLLICIYPLSLLLASAVLLGRQESSDVRKHRRTLALHSGRP